MEPAPMAMMTNAFPISVSKPRDGIMGATMAEVTIIATVEAPMAVFKSAEMIKGKNTPMERESSVEESASANGRLFKIAPKAPPAPVMTRMEAEFNTPWVIHSNLLSPSEAGMSVIAKKIPMRSAMTGSPMNEAKVNYQIGRASCRERV